MDFAQASRMRLRAKDETDAFTRACKDQETDIKDELEGVVNIFKNVLSSGDSDVLQLRDGSYLYMKANTSTRALNEDRLGAAVDNISYNRIASSLDPEQQTLCGILCASLEENLEDECVKVSYTPSLAKRRPTALAESTAARPASDAVERAAKNYKDLRNKLSAIRKHKSAGRKRCAEVKELTEPVICAYMDEKETTQQRVRFVSSTEAAPTPVQMELPEMPTLLPSHTPETKRAKHSDVVLKTDVTTPRTVEFKKRVYTSRGKAPKLRQFSEAMAPRVRGILGNDGVSDSNLRKWSSVDSKRALMASLLQQYEEQYSASKGETKQRLTMHTM